jgi:trans-aconitate methyltransferase
MARFENDLQSHQHSLTILNQLAQYDNFLENLSSIADMGCGLSDDIVWWATKENTFEEPPVPYNYTCYAVDHDSKMLDRNLPDNVHKIVADFETKTLPRPVDFIWSHNSFQYALSPVNTLRLWNQQMNENGMLYICVPTHRYTQHNRMVRISASHEYYSHTMSNLMYMLAVNGFDCNDAYFLKNQTEPWIHAAVYKTAIEPMDPRQTSWEQLAALDLLNPSAAACVNKYGHVKEDELIFTWLDRSWHYCRD